MSVCLNFYSEKVLNSCEPLGVIQSWTNFPEMTMFRLLFKAFYNHTRDKVLLMNRMVVLVALLRWCFKKRRRWLTSWIQPFGFSFDGDRWWCQDTLSVGRHVAKNWSSRKSPHFRIIEVTVSVQFRFWRLGVVYILRRIAVRSKPVLCAPVMHRMWKNWVSHIFKL